MPVRSCRSRRTQRAQARSSPTPHAQRRSSGMHAYHGEYEEKHYSRQRFCSVGGSPIPEDESITGRSPTRDSGATEACRNQVSGPAMGHDRRRCHDDRRAQRGIPMRRHTKHRFHHRYAQGKRTGGNGVRGTAHAGITRHHG